MRTIKLVVMNCIGWLAAHLFIASLSSKIHDSFFERYRIIFKTFAFEQSGELWNHLFKVRRWKDQLPDGSKLISNGFDKSRLPDYKMTTLKKFIIEMRRAELAHWLSMLPAPFFLIFNPRWAGMINVLYAFVSNFPFIITQRYNRPKLEKLYQYKLDKKK